MTVQNNNGLIVPVPWRKPAPLHKKLGARSWNFAYPASAILPTPAAPLNVFARFDASSAIDRVVGFYLSIGPAPQSCDVNFTENDTLWQFNYTYPGAKGVNIWGNIQTFPDQIDLSISFDVDVASYVFLSLFNYEVVPCIIS